MPEYIRYFVQLISVYMSKRGGFVAFETSIWKTKVVLRTLSLQKRLMRNYEGLKNKINQMFRWRFFEF